MTPYTEQIRAACAGSYSVEQFDAWFYDLIRKEREEAWDEGYSMGAVDIWLSETQNPYKEEA